MARHFVRLKLTLLRNALHSGPRRVISLIIGVVAWGWIVVTAISVYLAPASKAVAVPLIFDTFFVGWLLLPLMGLGSDETLDPSRLALLPLSRRSLMGGLVCASLVGVAPVGTLLALVGALAGSSGGAHAVMAIGLTAVAIAVELVLCVVASRAVTTGFSGILRSRRGRDLMVFVIAIVAVLPLLASQIIPHLAVKVGAHGVSVGATRSLFWIPSGWLARAVLDARSGHGLAAAALIVAGGAVVAALLGIWALALQRTLTTAEAGGSKKSPATRADLFAGPFALLPRSRVGAIAAKELRYTWRDPRRRAALVTVIFIIGLPAVAFARHQPSPRVVLLAAGAALVFGLQALNQFGSDGAAFWIDVASGRDPAVDFLGKNLASAILGLSVALVAGVLLAAVTGGWVYLPAAIVIGGGVAGVALGVANQVSVLAPFPLPDAATNLWAGPGCLTALGGFLAMAIILALLVPVGVGVAVSLHVWPGGFPVVCAASALYGWALWRLGLAMATRRLRARELDVLAIVSGLKGA
ncbi:MAG: hypothetical protein ACRDJU_13590 [Actinomycetota bacterium]